MYWHYTTPINQINKQVGEPFFRSLTIKSKCFISSSQIVQVVYFTEQYKSSENNRKILGWLTQFNNR